MRYYLGAGGDRKEGFVHVDMYGTEKSDFIVWDLRKGLPPQVGEAECFFMSHSNEHLSKEVNIKLLTQCYERLRKGGKIYLEIPDYETAIKAYYEKDSKFFNDPHFRGETDWDEIMEMCLYQPNNGVPEHISFCTPRRLCKWLRQAGFKDPKQVEYQEGINNPDPLRIRYSVYVEATKDG